MTDKNVVSNDQVELIAPRSGEKRTRVYLDNCAYNRPYDDQSQTKIELETQAKLKIQRLITDKQIELASAIFASADYFISTDSRLLKYQTDKIKLINPVDYFIDESVDQ